MANVIRIEDFDDERLDVYARLTENQLLNRADPENAMFIAESPIVIERALDAGCIPLSLLMEPGHIEHQAKAVVERCGDVPVFTAEESVLTRLTGFKLTRGVLSAMLRPKPKTPAEICKNATRIAVLEDVMNPTNLGAIFRSAAALGIEAVLLTHGSTNPLYRRSVRVSMGTVFQVPWAYLGVGGIDEVKALGFTTCAMALRDDSYAVYDKALAEIPRLAIVLGTEGDGLSDATIDACDYTVKIPMYHGVDSLNVAAASAVAFYQLAVLNKNNNFLE